MRKGIVLFVILAIFALVPMLVKTYVDENIQDEVSVLSKKGVELKILNENGYFSSVRDFELSIKDVEKFAMSMKDISSNLSLFSSLMTSPDFRKFFEKMLFKGSIENSNINYFDDIKVNIYLDKVSDELMKDLAKDKTNPLYIVLEKKLLNFDMNFSNKGVFKTSRLKDIDEKFKSQEGETLDLKILAQSLENHSDKKLKIKTVLDKFFINFMDKQENFEFSFEDFEYNYSGKDDFVADASMTFKNTSVNTDELRFDIADVYSDSKGDVKENKYDVRTVSKISDFKFEDKLSGIKSSLDSFKLDMDILGLDYPSARELMDYYYNSQSNILTINDDKDKLMQYMKDTEKMVSFLVVVLNKGFNIKMNTNLDELSYASDSIKYLNINLDAKIKENNFDMNKTHPLVLLSYLDVKSKIKIDEKGFETLAKFVPPLAMVLSAYAKKENDHMVFDIEFKNGNLSINAKPFALR